MEKNRTRRPEASGALATDRATQTQVRDKYRTGTTPLPPSLFLPRESTNKIVHACVAAPHPPAGHHHPIYPSPSASHPFHPITGFEIHPSIHPKQRKKKKRKGEKSTRKHKHRTGRNNLACEARPLRFDRRAGKMDAFYSTSSAAASGWGYDSLKNFREISPAVQSHLKLVYLTLCFALASSAVGAYLHIALNIGGMLTMLACVGTIAWMFSVPVYEERKRFGLLMGAALLEGASVGPLIELAIDFDPSILVTGFVGTAIAFGCFSGAAIIAKRREYLYLGGLLSSGLSILLWLQFATSIFGHSSGSFMFEVYFGLLIFLGYMVYDTQEIIERAHHGDMDYIKHALTLFTDFVAVLVRVLIIMLKNAGDKSEDKKKRKRRS
ncbi:hypothetical protein VPH35_115478 [Triticum aestivum]